MWEFPGGKIHAGESLQTCIEREIREELAVEIQAGACLDTLCHTYPDKTIRLHFLACSLGTRPPERGTEGQPVAWFSPNEMDAIPIAPADQEFVQRLRA